MESSADFPAILHSLSRVRKVLLGNRIACLSCPQNDQRFFNPIEDIAFGPMEKSYTDYKRFSDNNESAITLDVEEFASWIEWRGSFI